ncbi:MAG TPA: hypothetical protein VF190_03165 [Rhodothermales bacterium]
MNKSYKIALFTLILPMLALTACQRTDTDVSIDSAASDSIRQQISAFLSELQSELQQIDSELNEVEQGLAQTGDSLASDLDVNISELRQERQEIETNLQQLSQDATEEWQDTRSDLRRRVDALAVDVSRARMMAAESVDEFKSIAQEELSEIETSINRIESESDMAMNGTTDSDGMSDDMAQDEPLPNAEDQRVDPTAPGIGDAPMTGGVAEDATQLHEEHQELAQNVEELTASTSDDQFEDRKEELADAIADLNAEVRQAVMRMTEGSDFVQAEY